jgi:hypothetical protein
VLPYQPGVKRRDHHACNFLLLLPGCDCVVAVLPPPLCACMGMLCSDFKLYPHNSLPYSDLKLILHCWVIICLANSSNWLFTNSLNSYLELWTWLSFVVFWLHLFIRCILITFRMRIPYGLSHEWRLESVGKLLLITVPIHGNCLKRSVTLSGFPHRAKL